MKVGDLVRCIWQPRARCVENGRTMPMELTIKGELGLIVRQHAHYNVVAFPHLGYTHDLAAPALEVINESR